MEPTHIDPIAPGASITSRDILPISIPSILGFFAFGATTFMIGAHLAGWYGNAASPLYLWPLAAAFGGLVQLLAGMWAFRWRDGLAAVVHSTWGAFYLAYGALYLAASFSRVPVGPRAFPELGFWFVAVGAVTCCCILGALARNVAVVSTLTLLAGACILMALAYFLDSHSLALISGYIFMASSLAALYAATAELMSDTFGREVLPVVRTHIADRWFVGSRRIEEPIIR